MDIITLLKIMRRRWLVVVPVLVVAATAGALLVGRERTQYTATGTVLLMVNSQTARTAGGNDEVAPSLASVALASALQRPPVRDELTARNLTSDYDAVADPEAAVVTVSVTGDDAQDVLDTAHVLAEMAPAVLGQVTGSEAASSVRVDVLGAPVLADVTFDPTTGKYSVDVTLAVASTGTVGNPFPPSGSTMVTLAELARRLDVLEAVRDVVPSGEYNVSDSSRSTAPILAITTLADQAADVPRAWSIVVDQLESRLAQLQTDAGVPVDEQTVLTTLVPPQEVLRTSSSIVRPAAAVGLLGISAACGAAILTDLVLERRKQAHAASDQWVGSKEAKGAPDEP
jgi:hypothetical protein